MNLHPRRGRPDPAFPIPLHTLLSLPRLQQRGFESPGEERGTEPDDFQWRILLPPRGWSSEGQRCCTGREAGPGAGGWGGIRHSPRRGPGRRLPALHRAGRGGKGEEGRGSKRERGCSTPDSWHPSHAKPWTAAAPPPPGTRRSAPTSAAWRQGRGRGRDWWAGISTTYWAGHWLRVSGRGPRLAAETRSL